MMKNKILKYGLGAILWMVFTFSVLAGPVDPPGEDDPIDPTPIDNAMMILVFAGIALGIYFLKSKEINSVQSEHRG